MSKFLFIFALIILTASCITIDKSQTQPAGQEDSDDSQERSYPEPIPFPAWAGPGWYGGVYINNENDYWNHYNHHYNNNHNSQRQGNHQRDQNQNRRGNGGRSGHQGGGGHH